MLIDQNLLFGVLALQLDHIDASQFAEACAIWASRKHCPLSDILVERGWINAEDQREIGRVLERKVRKSQGDVRKALDAAADPKVRDIMRSVQDVEVDLTVSQLGAGSGFVQLSPAEGAAGERSHYTLSRVHEQGGLGRVWVAFDKDLRREVALKEIRPDRTPSDLSLQRFVREAQITGQLEHPNIVPVYELGVDAERRFPFYAMRFVRGQTLAAAIEEYHQLQRAGKATPMDFRRLLEAFVSVCNALGYAHSKGVIHRDLKPANVMLGDFGQVIVLDWGLAKLVQQADEETAEGSPIELPDDLMTTVTRTGQALGTLAYMAPEQAAGRKQEIDRRTDIYGLGAILFRILTGERPHKGRDSDEVLRHAIESPTPEPQRLVPSVPKALNAICVKAMAKERDDRYPSALELAQDVQRWLADEPVSVCPERWHQRAARWARKHRTVTAAAAVSLLVITFVASAATVLIDQAWRAEAVAKRKALAQLQQSMHIVDVMATGVDEVLRYYPGSQRLRLRLLDEAAQSYAHFATEKGDDPQVRMESGAAWMRLGNVYRLAGETQKAVQAYQDAADVFSDLHAMPRIGGEACRQQAICQRRLGDVWKDENQYVQAEQSYLKAKELLKQASSSVNCRRDQVEVLLGEAQLANNRKQTALAEELLKQARAMLLPQEEKGPAPDAQTLALLALVHSFHGQVLVAAGRNGEADKPLSDACDTYANLRATDPDYPPYLEGLAFARLNLAVALRPLGQPRRAADALDNAIAEFRQLRQALSELPHLRENQALATAERGLIYHLAGRNQEAKSKLDEAIQEFSQLADSPAGCSRHFERLAYAGTVQGRILRDLGLDSAAENNLRSAVRLYVDQLLPPEPTSFQNRLGLAIACRHLGLLLQRAAQTEGAEKEFWRAVQLLEELQKEHADDPYVGDELAACYEHLSDAGRAAGQDEKAVEHLAKAQDLRSRLPDFPEYSAQRVRLLLKHADKKNCGEAASLADRLVNTAPGNGTSLTLRALVHFRAGEPAACIERLEAADVTEFDASQAERHFLLAMAYRQRNEPGDLERANQHFEQALERANQESPGDLNLIRLRDEAAALLGRTVTSAGR